MKIRIKKLDDRAVIPTYGSEYSAGADLYALTDGALEILPHETVFIHTGISVEIPEGYCGLVFARSSMGAKRGLAPANKVGVIDADYRGEVMVALHNHSEKPAWSYSLPRYRSQNPSVRYTLHPDTSRRRFCRDAWAAQAAARGCPSSPSGP